MNDDSQMISQLVKQDIALLIGAGASLGITGKVIGNQGDKGMHGDTNAATNELGQQDLAPTDEAGGMFDNFGEFLSGS